MRLELSDRCKRIREKLINTDPIICAERAEIWTESFKQNESKPPILKSAIALEETLKKMTIHIYDDELIVGNQGNGLRASTVNPAVNTWVADELDRFEKRDQSVFRINQETKEKIRKLVPCWKGKSVYDRTLALLEDKTIDVMNAGVFTCGYTLSKGCGHWLLNFEKVLEGGFKSIEKQARERLAEISFADPEGTDKIPLYKAVIIVCNAVKAFAERYSKLAAKMAKEETDGKRKKELELISTTCAKVPYEAPETFYEAVQTVYFIQLITQIESDGTGISLGRLDRLLQPYYERDIAEGRMNKREAEELLDCLWLKLSSIIQAWNEKDTKAFGGHPISQAVTLGGMNEDGTDATNDLTFMMLETTARVRMPQPSVCVRVNKNTPRELLIKCAEVIKEGLGMPAMFNDDIAIPSLASRGISIEEAREYYGIIGCVEMGIQGKLCAFANSGYFNLLKVLEITMNDGKDPVSGKQLGPHTGRVDEFANFDEFLSAYYKQMDELLNHMVAVTNVVDNMHARIAPLPFVTAITDNCVERGIEVQSGGAKYNYDGIQGVGLADVADSLATIKKFVFEEKSLSMNKLMAALTANFDGYEDVRLKLTKEAPRYGNNDKYVDSIARDVARKFCKSVEKHKNLRGGFFVAGMYSNSANVPLGEVCLASPNGRKAFMPVTDACSPSHGAEKNGPTQAALSVANLDHMIITNGSQYNQKYHPSVLSGEKGLHSLADLISTFFEAGGYHIQFNVVSKETLKEAQKNPEQYKDLVVRVAGYTAFFVDLSEEIQNDIIDRTELGFD